MHAQVGASTANVMVCIASGIGCVQCGMMRMLPFYACLLFGGSSVVAALIAEGCKVWLQRGINHGSWIPYVQLFINTTALIPFFCVEFLEYIKDARAAHERALPLPLPYHFHPLGCTPLHRFRLDFSLVHILLVSPESVSFQTLWSVPWTPGLG